MAQEGSKKNLATVKETKEATAKKYVDEQLQLLRKHGSLTKLSKSGYNSIVSQVVKVTR